MGTPKVTVLVPVYNREKFISQCIESTINQTFKDWKLVVVDDASTDNTLNIVCCM